MTESPWTLQREARLIARETQLDPLGQLDPAERRRRAEQADRLYFRELGRKSGAVRRERAERLRRLEQDAIERALAS